MQVLAQRLRTARHVAVVGNGAIALELVGALAGSMQVCVWVWVPGCALQVELTRTCTALQG
jgi:hypothetical protein